MRWVCQPCRPGSGSAERDPGPGWGAVSATADVLSRAGPASPQAPGRPRPCHHPHPRFQDLRHPAPGARGRQPVPADVLLLLHRHLLHRGLRRRDAQDLAVPAAGGHHDLRGPRGAPAAGVSPARRGREGRGGAPVLGGAARLRPLRGHVGPAGASWGPVASEARSRQDSGGGRAQTAPPGPVRSVEHGGLPGCPAGWASGVLSRCSGSSCLSGPRGAQLLPCCLSARPVCRLSHPCLDTTGRGLERGRWLQAPPALQRAGEGPGEGSGWIGGSQTPRGTLRIWRDGAREVPVAATGASPPPGSSADPELNSPPPPRGSEPPAPADNPPSLLSPWSGAQPTPSRKASCMRGTPVGREP